MVVGAGMIGLLAIQCVPALRFFHDPCRRPRPQPGLRLPRSLGADQTFFASDPDLVAKLLAATGGEGADVAVEVVGAQASVTTAIAAVRRGGAP